MQLEYNNEDTFKNIFCKYTDGFDIYVCGAGENGRVWAEWLKKNDIKQAGFIDKRTDFNELNGIKVYTYNELKCIENVNKAMFIISSKNWEEELIIQLYENGINEKQIIIMKDYSIINRLLEELRTPLYTIDHCNAIKKFKNIHSDKRAFIIGNGPSLRVEDLEKLKNEICFGTNSIIDIYPKTEWRLKYYFIEDRVLGREILSENEKFDYILKNNEIVFAGFVTAIFEEYANKEIDNLLFYKMINCNGDIKNKYDYSLFSEDVSIQAYALGTTLYSIYQIAVYMGIKEIYLIGVDFEFEYVVYADGSKETNNNVITSPKWMKTDGIQPPVYLVDHIYCAHKSAKKYADEHGIKIYNATRGGKLDVFERVDFDTLFP